MSSSKPLPILSEMPWNVKQIIVDLADTPTKLIVNQCSKEFKHLVDQSKIHYEKLVLHSKSNNNSLRGLLIIGHKWISVELQSHSDGFLVKHQIGNQEQTERVVNNGKTFDSVVERSLRILKMPKVTLKHLNIIPENMTFLEIVQKVLSTRKHKLRVEEFGPASCPLTLLLILPFLEAGTLKSLRLERKEPFPKIVEDIQLDEIAELEQFKQATTLELDSLFLSLPFEKWSHFNDIVCHIKELSVSNLRDMVDCFIRKPNFKKCEVFCNNCDLQAFFENLLQLNPEITGTEYIYWDGSRESGSIKLDIDVPNDPNVLFEVYITCFEPKAVSMAKLQRYPDENRETRVTYMDIMGGTEEVLKLTPAEALVNIAKYIN